MGEKLSIVVSLALGAGFTLLSVYLIIRLFDAFFVWMTHYAPSMMNCALLNCAVLCLGEN